jgi:hypothetical protein
MQLTTCTSLIGLNSTRLNMNLLLRISKTLMVHAFVLSAGARFYYVTLHTLRRHSEKSEVPHLIPFCQSPSQLLKALPMSFDRK